MTDVTDVTEEHQNRRSYDPRVERLVLDVAELGRKMECAQRSREAIKLELAVNTEISRQIQDAVASFKIIATVAKWLTVVAGAVIAVIAMVKGIVHFNDVSN